MVNSGLFNFNGEDRIATIRRYLIILYLANMHPLFKDAGKVYNDSDNLRYFSGPKLIKIVYEIAKEWGSWIKFDRSRTATKKYEICESNGYVKIKTEPGNIKLFALRKEGFRHCEDIINSFYRIASTRDLSKVRVIAINTYLKNTYFLAIKEDGSYVLSTANNDLKNMGITENSLIEYNMKELDDDFEKLPFECRVEYISSNSLHILDDDGSLPRTKDIMNTDIKDIKIENELYYIRGEIISRRSPDDEEGIKEIEDKEMGKLTIQDSTGKIQYIKIPYDSGWQEEAIRVGTWVEAIGIFKSRVKISEDTITTSLYAPYKVEFLRPFRHHPQRSYGRKHMPQIEHPFPPSIENIANKDPCVSIPAVNQLTRQNAIEFENFADILKQEDFSIVNQYVVLTLCEVFPKQSAPILLKMILDANDDWHTAMRAANCLGPFHREFAEGELIRELKKDCFSLRNVDVARVCIESLGNIRVDLAQYDLTDSLYIRRPGEQKIQSGYYDKYYHFVSRALARVFLNSDSKPYEQIWYNSDNLQNMLGFAINDKELSRFDAVGNIIDSIKEIFIQCTSFHVDVLVKDWLFSEEIVFRKVGAFALGMTRTSRVVPHLIKILNNKAEHVEVLDEVSTALGSIGGVSAVKALLYQGRIGAIGYALGELNDLKLYNLSMQRYLESSKDSNDEVYRVTRLLAYRAIGLKKDKRYNDMLRQLLHGSSPGFRGVAALALARINGSKELAALTKAYEESGSPMERIMTGLGLLLIRSPESDDILGHLQNDLTIDSQTDEPYLSDWRFRADIFSILRNTRKPLATQIANSWEMVYHRRGN